MSAETKKISNILKVYYIYPGISAAVVLALFFLAYNYNYLLFHVLAEMFSVIVAATIFVIAWNSRRHADNQYFIFLGIAYLFIGAVDFAHMLAYKGMNIFPGYGINFATQLWLGARYLEALSFVAAALFITRPGLRPGTTFALYGLALGLFAALVFGGIFPATFIEGAGLTAFKVGSEYVISGLLAHALALLIKHRKHFEKEVFRLLAASIILTICSEMSFTLYADPYGFFNLLGHFFKIASFFLIYRAIVVTALRDPQKILFSRLKENEERVIAAKKEWERTFDSMPDLIAIMDKEHRIIRANRAMADRLGLDLKKSKDIKCFECVHGKDGPPASCPHSMTMKDGREHRAELREERLGGDFLVTTTPLFDRSGKITGSVHVARDVTERKRTEEALRRSREDLNRAQAVGGIGSWRLDVRKDELTWSDENYRIFGIPKGTPLTYETFLSMVHPDDRAYVDAKWKAGLAGEPYDIEHRIIAAGRTGWVREKAYLEFDDSGVLQGGFGITQDITELKGAERALRESEEKYKTLTETSPDCIKLFDTKGNLIYINEGGLKEHGLKNVGEARRWDYIDCVIPEDRPKFRKALEDAARGRVTTIEIRHEPEGSDRDVCLETVVPIKNDENEITHIFGVSRDISEQKKVESAKTEFVSLASHQLRTPLTSAGFALEGMIEGMAGKLNGEQKEYARDAYRDIKYMTDVVNRLLSVSRIEMGTFTEEPQTINIREFLTETARGVSPLAEAKTIKLVSEYAEDLPETIAVDPGILRNIVQNLIMNAIKYTPAYGRIVLGAGGGNPEIVITVADNGLGIPEDIQPKLFTKMFRAHDLFSREAESSGLGLYIAKLFTESLGGKIWFESRPGKGTTFCVSLPREGGAA